MSLLLSSSYLSTFPIWTRIQRQISLNPALLIKTYADVLVVQHPPLNIQPFLLPLVNAVGAASWPAVRLDSLLWPRATLRFLLNTTWSTSQTRKPLIDTGKGKAFTSCFVFFSDKDSPDQKTSTSIFFVGWGGCFWDAAPQRLYPQRNRCGRVLSERRRSLLGKEAEGSPWRRGIKRKQPEAGKGGACTTNWHGRPLAPLNNETTWDNTIIIIISIKAEHCCAVSRTCTLMDVPLDFPLYVLESTSLPLSRLPVSSMVPLAREVVWIGHWRGSGMPRHRKTRLLNWPAYILFFLIQVSDWKQVVCS